MTKPRAMPEFSRLVNIGTLGPHGKDITLRAAEKECVALARRMDLLTLSDLQAKVSLRRTAAGLVRLNVAFSANVVQSCVVSLAAVRSAVADRFSLLCESDDKHPALDNTGGEVFVDPFGEDPVEPLDGGNIDVGELVAQHLSLSLDAYPRARAVGDTALDFKAGADGKIGIEDGVGAAYKELAHNCSIRERLVGKETARKEPAQKNAFAALEQWRPAKQGDGSA